MRQVPVKFADKPTSPRLAGGVGGYLFVAGAMITAAAMLLPHPSTVDTTGYWYLCVAQLLLSALLLGLMRINAAPQRWLAPATIIGAIVVVSAAIYLNGERSGGPALMNEFFYVWPALYAGYFFKRVVVVAVVVAIALAYWGVAASIGVSGEAFAVRALDVVAVVAGTAALAHTLRLYVDGLVRRLDRLARTDSLTTLLNRRGFDERMALELRRLQRTTQPLSLLVGDLDRFKLLNDRFGHAAGDEVLERIGRVLSSSLRGVDAVARVGGEEFALLLPSTSATAAVELADRLRPAIATVRDPAGTPVEITFGVASTENPECYDADSLLRAADRALYAAKAGGRNRTLTYEASMSDGLVAV